MVYHFSATPEVHQISIVEPDAEDAPSAITFPYQQVESPEVAKVSTPEVTTQQADAYKFIDTDSEKSDKPITKDNNAPSVGGGVITFDQDSTAK